MDFFDERLFEEERWKDLQAKKQPTFYNGRPDDKMTEVLNKGKPWKIKLLMNISFDSIRKFFRRWI